MLLYISHFLCAKGATFLYLAELSLSSMSTMAPSMNSNAITLSGAIMVAAVVVIFFLFVFFLILYLRSNLYFGPDPTIERSSAYASGSGRASVFHRALHPAIFKSLPLAVFSSEDVKDGVECAVCISEIAEGEQFRLLPGCRHGFHLECIDLWFGSNSTCPVCRSSVELPKMAVLSNVEQSVSENVGSLGEDCSGEGSSRRPDGLQVEILINEMESSSFSLQSEEIKSSLCRTGSEKSRAVSSACSSRGWDVEKGLFAPPAAATIEVQGE